ncbi:MAG: B12-binding domain-containing radical SAM protein [Planctomycetes bacterium]|nr:B12-binding domain-containing radical SAM protein [Planctomycetota bacterium]
MGGGGNISAINTVISISNKNRLVSKKDKNKTGLTKSSAGKREPPTVTTDVKTTSLNENIDNSPSPKTASSVSTGFKRRWKLRLINPRSPLSTITMPEIIQKMTFSRRALFMPLNLAICAAVVPDDWDVEIIDENVTEQKHKARADVDAVGIGAMTTQARRAYEIADDYRRLNVPVILGGIHPSALPEEALEHATIVCRGDAEGTLPRALKDLQEGKAKRFYDWTEQPDAPIATPRKDLLNPADYLVFNPIQTTRGCPHNCTFCTTPAIFGRKFRQREISDIVEEVAQAYEQFRTRVFIFSDDDVAGNHAWAMELFERLKPLKIRWASQCDILIADDDKLLAAMRDSGCIGIIIGLESPKSATLTEAGKRYAKAELYEQKIRKIQSYGISVWGSFIFGFDSDDWQDCMNAVRFAQRTNLCMSCYPILTPYPGTAIFEQFRRQGRLLTTEWDKYNGATVVFKPKKMTEQQLRHAQMAAFYEFYTPKSMFRRLKILPLKKYSYLANMAIYRGIRYYYEKRGRPLPKFTDFIATDADKRIARSLGETNTN